MIRILHTSDWHLGRIHQKRELIEDQRFSLARLIELIISVEPHALLIAGDIFDKSVPSAAAVQLLSEFLQKVAGDLNVPVLMISGNHDSSERIGFASKLLRDRNVVIFSSLEDSLVPHTIEGDAGDKVEIYGIPFVEPNEVSQFLDQKFSDSTAATRALCEKILTERTSSNLARVPALLMCHAFVAGGLASDSENIFVGGSTLVDARVFEGFAYTALGHLHRPQKVGAETVRYSGSLLPYSKSEVGHKKEIVEIKIEKGAVSISSHHLPQLRQLRTIEGTIDELIENAKKDSAPNDYIIASYTDKDAILDPARKLFAYYPNLLSVSRPLGHMPEQTPGITRQTQQKQLSDLELFNEFFKDATGAELGASEREVLIEALKELERGEKNSGKSGDASS